MYHDVCDIGNKSYHTAAGKAVVDSPVGQVLARPLFFKVKTKFHFTESK